MKIVILDSPRWKEAKELRLQALQTDPAAFASNYKEEAILTDQKWIDWLQSAQDNKSYLLFAEHNNKLIGMVGAIIEETKKQATIIAMYVDPRYRSRRVAKQLMQELLNKLDIDERIAYYTLKVNVEALHAIALYKGLGFKKIMEEPMNTRPFHTEWVMKKYKYEEE